MQSKYTLLCSVYRYQPFMRTVLNPEAIAQDLLETAPAYLLRFRDQIVEALRSNYGVRSAETTLEILRDLDEESYVVLPAYSILFEMYREYGKELRSEGLRGRALEKYASTAEIKKTLEHFHEGEIPVIMDGSQPVSLVVAVGNELRSLLAPESKQGEKLLGFFEEYQTFLVASEGLPFLAFNYSRMVDIIASAGNVGYLSEDEVGELLEHIGGHAERLFSSWNAFWASAIVGKAWQAYGSGAKGKYIIEAKDYTLGIYGLASMQATPFKLFGLWEGSDIEALKALLAPLVDTKAEEELGRKARTQLDERRAYLSKRGITLELEGKALQLAEECFLRPARASGLAYYLKEEGLTRELVFPQDDEGCDYNFWSPLTKWQRKMKIVFEADEVPFMYAKRHIFTNKWIYRVRRKSLFFNELDRIEWREADFSFMPSGAGWISCKLQGEIFADLLFGKERIPDKTTWQIRSMKDEELAEILTEDLTNFRTAFAELVACFSK